MSAVFKAKLQPDQQKLRGGYYTPKELCDYLCAWAIREKDESVLEPSCGDGNFLVSAIERFGDLHQSSKPDITAVEILPDEMSIAVKRVSSFGKASDRVRFIQGDFFSAYPGLTRSKFDVVIGNPPFIRFQHFDTDSREKAFAELRNVDYHPNKLANAWAAFIQLSIELLIPGGRLAMVVPAELLQVKYAHELRQRMIQSFDHVVLVTFKKLVFPQIQQEVVLVLAEGKRSKLRQSNLVHTIEIQDSNDLSSASLDSAIAHCEARHSRKGMKWTSFFLNDDRFRALDAAQRHESITALGSIVSIDVGIVTGRNSFFVVDSSVVKKYKLAAYCRPLVGKTSAISKLQFDKKNLNEYQASQNGFLLDLKGVDESTFNAGLRRYLSLGEKEGVPLGYKCRIRKRWFDVPSVYTSDAFLFRQIHRYPLLVTNDSGAACTDTIHRVKVLKPHISIQLLSACFVNSLTFAWAEVCGRSYGGGVLELEPAEAEELPIPYFEDCELDIGKVREHIAQNNVTAALDYVDEKLLIEKLGLSRRRVRLLRKAWETLRDRRINRL